MKIGKGSVTLVGSNSSRKISLQKERAVEGVAADVIELRRRHHHQAQVGSHTLQRQVRLLMHVSTLRQSNRRIRHKSLHGKPRLSLVNGQMYSRPEIYKYFSAFRSNWRRKITCFGFLFFT